MKPGWKTTEFWQALIAQGLALLTLGGFVSAGDSQTLGDSLAKCITAIFALIANGFVVVKYINTRFHLKALNNDAGTSQKLPMSPTSIAGFLVIACTLLTTSPLQAQSIFPWRDGIMKQLREHDQKLNQLHNQPQAPAPAPQIIVMPPAQPPLQSLPIQGQPQQSFPIQGQPKQDFPIQGQPRQELPIHGQPQQQMPIQGQPQQQFPIQGPAQPLPIQPPNQPPGPQLQGPQAYSIQRALAQPIN